MDNNSLAHTKWNCKYHTVFHIKISQTDYLQANIGGYRVDHPYIMRPKGSGDYRGGGHAGSHSPLCGNSAEVQCSGIRRISKGKEQPNDIRSALEPQVQIWKQAFLVQRVLCGYSREERENDKRICS